MIFTADINSERGHFILQISPWKQCWQKKQSRPWRSQRKIPQNCHLRFFIFETLSQRFFAAKVFFSFFPKTMKIEPTEKMDYIMTRPTVNPSKLSSQIFEFWNFVTEIFHHKIPNYYHQDLTNKHSAEILVTPFFCSAKKILPNFFVRST